MLVLNEGDNKHQLRSCAQMAWHPPPPIHKQEEMGLGVNTSKEDIECWLKNNSTTVKVVGIY